MFWSWPVKSSTWQEPRSVQSFMTLPVSFVLHRTGGHACMQGHQGWMRHLPGPHSTRWYIACAYIGSLGKWHRSCHNRTSEKLCDSPQMCLAYEHLPASTPHDIALHCSVLCLPLASAWRKLLLLDAAHLSAALLQSLPWSCRTVPAPERRRGKLHTLASCLQPCLTACPCVAAQCLHLASNLARAYPGRVAQALAATQLLQPPQQAGGRLGLGGGPLAYALPCLFALQQRESRLGHFPVLMAFLTLTRALILGGIVTGVVQVKLL